MHQLYLVDKSTRYHEQALQVLGLSLEYRDYETMGHTERVSSLAMSFGEALSFNRRQMRDLRWGAYLHDVGKIAIPDSILQKKGALDDEEWELMRRHTLIGEDFAQHLEFLNARVLGIIRSHHEKWDGTGYPDQLAGDEIPLLARVFAIVDIYDALTGSRPYKSPWPVERAIDKIASMSGSHLDPQLAKVFLDFMATDLTATAG